MTRRDSIILQKMIGHAQDAQSFISESDFDSFMQDKKTMQACAFAIGQMGELVTLLHDDVMADYPNIPWRSIKGLRNRIVHDYENIDLPMLWGTIVKSLPELIASLSAILEAQAESFGIESVAQEDGPNMTME
jgi:uncharacterized protein with HEPN domain